MAANKMVLVVTMRRLVALAVLPCRGRITVLLESTGSHATRRGTQSEAPSPKIEADQATSAGMYREARWDRTATVVTALGGQRGEGGKMNVLGVWWLKASGCESSATRVAVLQSRDNASRLSVEPCQSHVQTKLEEYGIVCITSLDNIKGILSYQATSHGNTTFYKVCSAIIRSRLLIDAIQLAP